MIGSADIQQVVGADAYGSDGAKIGRIGQVFLDDQTGEPVFATVNTGLFGMAETFVPLANASLTDAGRVDIGFDRETVRQAPNVSPDGGHLSPEEEQRLYDYYELTYAPMAADTGEPTYQQESTEEQTGAATAQTSTGQSDTAMTRSEEQMRVATEREVAGRARLRKYVVTENVTMTVPVRREKAVLERVPVGEEDMAEAGEIIEGAPASGEQPEVILREEVPVVETVVKPVERVRLGKEQYTEQETVTGEVRKEQIAVEGDVVDGEDITGSS
jgi:uncharacterized protein (TIGR02271 family)